MLFEDRRCLSTQVHGKAVPVPTDVDLNDKDEFEKAVDQLHDAVVQELQALYDR